jgi:hypothetical protein
MLSVTQLMYRNFRSHNHWTSFQFSEVSPTGSSPKRVKSVHQIISQICLRRAPTLTCGHLHNFRHQQMHFYVYNTFSQYCYTRHVSAPITTPSSGVIPRSSHKIRMFRCRFEQYITYTLSGEWVHQFECVPCPCTTRISHKNTNHQQMHKESLSSIVTHSYMFRPCWVILRENFSLPLH